MTGGTEGNVHTIDCHYIAPLIAAAYLITDSEQAAFVENNTVHAVPRLLDALGATGLAPEQVRWIIITHVHLDHAGGTAELLRHCPNATVVAHPRAARHLINPTKLIESARAVYGTEAFERMYGVIEPVPEERVRATDDKEQLELGRRTLRFVYTLGHAKHHFCIHDSATNGIFTGDAFGIAYPRFQKPGRPFLFPSTTPTDFDPAEARRSIGLIRDTGATSAYLTHFGEFTDMEAGATQMIEGLNVMEEILHDAAASDRTGNDLQGYCEARVRKYFEERLAEVNFPADEQAWKLLRLDAEINAMGIAFAADRLRGA